MIDAVVQLNSRKARKKTRLMLFVRLGPKASDHGIPPAHEIAVKSVPAAWLGPIGPMPGMLQL